MADEQTIVFQKGVNTSRSVNKTTPIQGEGILEKQQIEDVNLQNSPQAVEKIHEDIAREAVKEEVAHTKKFEELLDQSQRVLLKISSVFPFDFFPDTLTVEETKINILMRAFFFSQSLHSIQLKDVQDIIVDSNLLFATIKIVAKGNPGGVSEPITLKYFQAHEANRARRIIQGLMVCSREGVDTTKLRTDHFLEKLEEMGKMNYAE